MDTNMDYWEEKELWLNSSYAVYVGHDTFNCYRCKMLVNRSMGSYQHICESCEHEFCEKCLEEMDLEGADEFQEFFCEPCLHEKLKTCGYYASSD